MSAGATWRERLEGLMARYGAVAIGVWFSLFFSVLAGFYVAIRAGFQVDGAVGTAGTVGAAYAATQLTKPARAVATVVLTPIVARFVGREPPEGT